MRTGYITGEFDLYEQEERLLSWKRGRFVVLFCTTCCAQCVDYAKVSMVVICFLADSVEQLQQMMCRGGRNGDVCQVWLLKYEGGKTSSYNYVKNGCIRLHIQLELDGADLAVGCKNRSSLCSWCELNKGNEFESCLSEELSLLSVCDEEGGESIDGLVVRSTLDILNEGKIVK